MPTHSNGGRHNKTATVLAFVNYGIYCTLGVVETFIMHELYVQ